ELDDRIHTALLIQFHDPVDVELREPLGCERAHAHLVLQFRDRGFVELSRRAVARRHLAGCECRHHQRLEREDERTARCRRHAVAPLNWLSSEANRRTRPRQESYASPRLKSTGECRFWRVTSQRPCNRPAARYTYARSMDGSDSL